jgi:hypothetical protein
MRPAAGFHEPHEHDETSVARGVLLVVEDVEIEHGTAPPADMAVAEIPPQQLGIGLSVQLAALAPGTRDRCVSLASRPSPPLVLAAPPANRLDRNAV